MRRVGKIYPNEMAPLVGLLELFMIPQKVTSRYARNLLIKGKNHDFRLSNLLIEYSMVETLTVGYYYTAVIHSSVGRSVGLAKTAVGVTPEQAVVRCLEKHGVTFR